MCKRFGRLHTLRDTFEGVEILFKLRNIFVKATKSQAAQSRQPCVNSHQLSQWQALGNSEF